jgi:hypothetical protein
MVRFTEGEIGTAAFAYDSEIVGNCLNEREHHSTGFRVVKRFLGEILSARYLSRRRAYNREMPIEVI